jgi:lipopolysaccharide export LptBFGC system permease protein LptF
MKILDRYIIVSMTQSYLICIGIAMIFYTIVDMFAKFNKFVEYAEIMKNTGQEATSLGLLIAQYYAYQSPIIFYNLTPILTLMAAMFTVTRMARANELLPLRACGIPMYRLLYPLLSFAMLSFLWMSVLQESVIPSFAQKIEAMDRVQHGRKMSLSGIQYCDNQYHIFFYVGRYSPPTMELEAIRIIMPYPISENGQHQVIEAKYGKWLERGRRHYLTLWDGRCYTYDAHGGLIENAILPEAGYEIRTNFRERHITYPEEKNLDTLSARKLWQMLEANPQHVSARVSLHGRFSFPLSNLLLIVLGVPWILCTHTRNFFVGIGICIIIASAFYGFYVLSLSMGYKEVLNPVFASWFPTVLFGSLGLSFLCIIHN